jgi:4-oxalocrotonate tautomerase
VPHVSIKLYPGRTEQQKTGLAEDILKSLVTRLECKEASVSIAIEEVEREDWTEKVYQPDIQDKWDKLYQKPGYTPSK